MTWTQIAEAARTYDAIAGCLGALAAVSNSEGSVSRWKAFSAIWLGTVSAVYGAPVLAEWQNLSRAAEHLSAVMIGLTAQTHIIPGIISAAAVVSKLPLRWVKSKSKSIY